MKATVKRLSICPCGFLALKAEIPLGYEYEIDPSRKIPVVFTCGGCGKTTNEVAVFIPEQRGAPAGYLPVKLFEEDPEQSLTA